MEKKNGRDQVWDIKVWSKITKEAKENVLPERI